VKPSSKPIGEVTHFYGGISVAIVKFKEVVKVGDEVQFFGATTDFKEKIKSMQYNHQDIMRPGRVRRWVSKWTARCARETKFIPLRNSPPLGPSGARKRAGEISNGIYRG